MKIALDTNRYVDFFKGEAKAVEILKVVEKIYLPFVVLGELRAGFFAGVKGRQNEKNLIRFLNTTRVEVLYANDQTTYHYASLFFQLRKQGTPIPTNDLWIAALTTQYNLMLFSRDAHFNHLPQIPKL